MTRPIRLAFSTAPSCELSGALTGARRSSHESPLRWGRSLRIGLSAALTLSVGGLLTACPGPMFTAEQDGTGGADAGNAECGPSPSEDPRVVNNACGVFVKTDGDDGSDGTREKPVATLGKAIEIAKNSKRRVYTCIGDYTGSVTVPAGVSIFGGLDCAGGWAPQEDARSTLTAAPDQVPLRLQGGAGAEQTRIEGFAVTAANAETAGGSSIAVIVEDGATIRLQRCALTAGNGNKGADGESGPLMAPSTPVVGEAQKGKDACSTMALATNKGGEQIENQCDVGEHSLGGAGGASTPTAGQSGQSGLPTGETMPNNAGAGGKVCTPEGGGRPGVIGVNGKAGKGGEGIGMLSNASGWVGNRGGDGENGTPGQGGGGGGGQKGQANVCAGASGGAGGAGGCGGKGGKGGQPGGSSIGLVSINASVTLTDVRIVTAAGGEGGKGGAAQDGGPGAAGALGGAGPDASYQGGCSGGTGGAGGAGGPGGGGPGGHSIGIAYLGTIPTVTGMSTVTLGSAGQGGLGGSMEAMNPGSAGLAAESKEFPMP